MAFKLNFLRMKIYRGKDYSKKENMKGNGFLILKMEVCNYSQVKIHKEYFDQTFLLSFFSYFFEDH